MTTIDAPSFTREWEQWHREHEERRADPLGFLAVTGLFWLGSEPTRAPGAPGSWTSGAEGPIVALADDEVLVHDGELITGRHGFGPLPERGGVTLGFTEGCVRGAIEVARRGGHDILRPRRADHPYLAAYTGTPVYEPDPGWRVPARFEPFDAPRPTEVGSAVDGLHHVYEAPGRLVFRRDGEEYALTAFPGRAAGSLLVLIRDATSGVTTYAANRSIAVPAPDAAGSTVIDFTRATNLPCAYTDFATCPLPPAENRLPFAVEAGERTPEARVHADAAPTPPH